MSYRLELSPRALNDLERIKKSGNKSVINKLKVIFQELMVQGIHAQPTIKVNVQHVEALKLNIRYVATEMALEK